MAGSWTKNVMVCGQFQGIQVTESTDGSPDGHELLRMTNSIRPARTAPAERDRAISLIVVANQFMQENKFEVAAFWQFVGQKFSAGWTDVAEGDIEEVARRISRIIASCGANLQTVERAAQQVQLFFSGWPPEWAVDMWKSSNLESVPMCEVFRPIEESLGFDYVWQLEDDLIAITVERPSLSRPFLEAIFCLHNRRLRPTTNICAGN